LFNIRFFNETGSIDFGGGNSGSLWKVTTADGLSFCGRTFTYAKYAGGEGRKTTDVTVNSRTITLGGDIYLGENFKESFKNAMTVLENEGILEINTPFGKRNITARCCDFLEGGRKGKYMLYGIAPGHVSGDSAHQFPPSFAYCLILSYIYLNYQA